MTAIFGRNKVTKEEEVSGDNFEYVGDVNVFDSRATKIPKIGTAFRPTTEDQIAQLEYQVEQGRVAKVLVEAVAEVPAE